MTLWENRHHLVSSKSLFGIGIGFLIKGWSSFSGIFSLKFEILPKIGFNAIRTLYGDGFAGAPRFAPFDSIVVTAGADSFPTQLWGQLKVGGKMIIPMGEEGQQQMFKFTKVDEKNYHREEHGAFQFVPFLKGVSI
mgnify:CR=1 FL=1